MGDIAPALIAAVKDELQKIYDADTQIHSLLNQIEQGVATYSEAYAYSVRVSALIQQAYREHVSSATLPDGKMYYNIAERLIPETMDENYKLVSAYAESVQGALNKKAGLGLKAQVADYEKRRVNGLVEMVSDADRYDNVAKEFFAAIETFSQNIVDKSIKKNAEFQHKAGLEVTIQRRSTNKCCEWCNNLDGKYSYPDVPEDVYRRHERCRCTVEYDPGTGRKQNVHTKQWR